MKPKIRTRRTSNSTRMRNRLSKRQMKYAHVERLGANKGKTARVSAISGALTAMSDSTNRASVERARANNDVTFTVKTDLNSKKEVASDNSIQNNKNSKSGDSENILGWIN